MQNLFANPKAIKNIWFMFHGRLFMLVLMFECDHTFSSSIKHSMMMDDVLQRIFFKLQNILIITI